MYLLCAILLLIILIFLTQKEPFDQGQQIWALSFGGGSTNFHEAVDRIHKELTDISVFDEIFTYKESVLKNDSSFWEEHGKFIENNSRGYGYWLWKPYLILKTMERMKEGDVLVYVDSGCEVVHDPMSQENVRKMKDQCKTILYTTTGEAEKKYTKMDVLNKLGGANEMNAEQKQATLILFKKTKITQDFIKDWYKNACNYFQLDDSSSYLENDITFVEHRHDQSIFSLLIKSDKFKKELNQPNNLLHELHPFLLTRKRSG